MTTISDVLQASPAPISLRDRALSLSPSALIAAAIAWAVGAGIAFRSALLSGFDVVFGNNGDGRLIVYLHEHLYEALRGRAEFLSPPFFYPQKQILGYTDAFLLDALPYAALRSLGIDPFLALQLLAIILSFCCFASVTIIGRRYLSLHAALAICAGLLITFPNNLMFKTANAHPNFFALYYVPMLVLLALWAVEDFPRPTHWSQIRAACFGLLYGLLFSTSFYVAWLFAITVAIAIGTLIVLLPAPCLAFVRTNVGALARLCVPALLGLIVGLIPVWLIYQPVLRATAGRSFRDYLGFAPFPKDLPNVGDQNLLWGWLIDGIGLPSTGDHMLSVTPGMTLITLLLVYWTNKGRMADHRPWPVMYGIVCAAVWAVSWLLTFRIGSFSPFWLLYHLVPGAAAIRVGGRIQLLTSLWVVTALAVLLQHAWPAAISRRSAARLAATTLIVAFCLLEQVNLRDGSLPRRAELERLAAVAPPPPDCEVFLVDARDDQGYGVREFDAMWISMRVGLPTLNGNSGWSPPGWQLADPDTDYDAAAKRWIEQTHITKHVCRYQRDARAWSDFEPKTNPALQPTAEAGTP
ncbi:hypothetical protein [Rhodopseudomonas telluris]|uniref:Glycosyltransferase RgtA/B/C/D-like domain-containing protein n=1 Tax=Rhodopseudomonas telluris TaxID=644215 RepID=A0ABV6EW78_9BRAD